MALEFTLAGSQIDGDRGYQEDAFLITNLTDTNDKPAALIIIADGMGGHAAGNVASNMAVQAFNKHVSTNYPSEDLAKILNECVLKANSSIEETVKETPALSGMGCTLVAAILESGKIWWASVGDSHLYVIRDKVRLKINADHSYGGFLDRMEAAGTPVEAEEGLARNMLMSAVMGEEISEIDVSQEPFELQDGDRIMICSDGMDTLSEGKFVQFSDWSENPKECSEALLIAVEDEAKPRQDNTTIVVVDVMEKAATEAPAAPAPTIEVEAVPLSATQPIAEAVQPVIEESEKKGGSGMIVGIAAVVVIGVAIGGFVMFSGGSKTSTPTQSSTAVVESVEFNDVEEQEITETTSEELETVEPETTPQQTAPAPVIAATGSSLMIAGSEFTDSLVNGSTGPTMVVIPSGNFDMGSSSSSSASEERPRHNVQVTNFAMSKHEVTFAEYEQFAAATSRKIPDNLYMEKESHPVIYVTWDDAFYYSRWLSEQTGERYNLPTENQWEYASGTAARTSFWWGYEEEPNRAHCFGCGSGLDPRKPTKVGSFGPNKFGVHDTAGNVAEWVRDCWHENYTSAPTRDEAWEGGDCALRVVRGGSYSSPPQSIRHAKRDKFKSDSNYDNIGIRLVREIE
ncbi:MAG: formylglycine-generating enzyme required for sulfatase activity/serine [Gammaproteobacteria bacterium]|jgi:formylglycine-generating enzyme required for sulfatase activity/serine/threonine protein phosphatase PrpC